MRDMTMQQEEFFYDFLYICTYSSTRIKLDRWDSLLAEKKGRNECEGKKGILCEEFAIKIKWEMLSNTQKKAAERRQAFDSGFSFAARYRIFVLSYKIERLQIKKLNFNHSTQRWGVMFMIAMSSFIPPLLWQLFNSITITTHHWVQITFMSTRRWHRRMSYLDVTSSSSEYRSGTLRISSFNSVMSTRASECSVLFKPQNCSQWASVVVVNFRAVNIIVYNQGVGLHFHCEKNHHDFLQMCLCFFLRHDTD